MEFIQSIAHSPHRAAQLFQNNFGNNKDCLAQENYSSLIATVFHTKRVENWFLDTLIILSKTKCPMKNKHVPP